MKQISVRLEDMFHEISKIYIDELYDGIVDCYSNSIYDENEADSEEQQNIIDQAIKNSCRRLKDTIYEYLYDQIYNIFNGDNINLFVEDETLYIRGNINRIGNIILNHINGYGMLTYNSLNELFDCCSAETEEEKWKALQDHFHWIYFHDEIYCDGILSGKILDEQINDVFRNL